MTVTVIGIGGASGSGKTTVAEELAAYYGPENCNLISIDRYYKNSSHIPLEERNYDHPDSLDLELLARHLAFLKNENEDENAEKTVSIPTYDFNTHSRTEEVKKVSRKPIIIIEGILALHPKFLTDLYDTKIFVSTDLDICLARRIERDMKTRGRDPLDIIEQYKRDVRPMYKQYVAPCEDIADIIIENSDDNFKTPKGVSFDISELTKDLEAKAKTKVEPPLRYKLFSSTIPNDVPITTGFNVRCSLTKVM